MALFVCEPNANRRPKPDAKWRANPNIMRFGIPSYYFAAMPNASLKDVRKIHVIIRFATVKML
jgi:hypothetical protein